jgi:rhamnosyltransferase
MSIVKNAIATVVVTYHPDHGRLERMLRVLGRSVDTVIVVDNASAALDAERLCRVIPDLFVERLTTNKGLAAAQNIGTEIASRLGASYVLFLDQDSVPAEDMVLRLREAFHALEAEGVSVGVVGPRFRTAAASGKLSQFARFGRLCLRVVPCIDDELVVECDILISSGSLIPLRVIQDVGGMEEELFIDNVDTEWCLRARAKGYRVFGACGAILEHELGENVHRLWIGRWRNLFRHKPFRYYYIFRNSIALFRRTYVPMVWKLYQLRWLAAVFITVGIVRGQRLTELRMMLKGIADGLRGVTGQLKTR